ncbi:PTS sugar transporter subunit IIA [Sporolactobacillus shoreicorticis]|uniref:PTS sugar transporter subunit IIA n=1 Tax=Sporolactobacillus shoreicorticis TaxID=1923877 RepID=A0ABW5S074_9BACL|nr:PTS sugar transporter subunit IIA [Sporolactobacillus shoreicorticis]MCO7124639.1 PTS sugar transporter subunit IIA [Sporolactobacillus shoreicorticis]
MKRIVVSGHGTFASGIRGSLEMLAGKQDSIQWIDFEETMSQEQLRDQFSKAIDEAFEQGNEMLFFTDIPGGTPYKVAAEFAAQSEKVALVGGCNTGSLLESIFVKEKLSLDKLADQLVTSTQNSVSRFGATADIFDAFTPDEDDDGI